MEENKESTVSPSEALYAFMGWLTTRNNPVTFSGSHDAGEAVNLIKQFTDSQGWGEPRDHWDKNIKSYSLPEGKPVELNPGPSETSTFQQELLDLINKHTHEIGETTPGFLLVQYLCTCLEAHNNSVFLRDDWLKNRYTVSQESGDKVTSS
jgi:hypothetical protein